MLGLGFGLNKWRRLGGGYVGLLDLYPNAAAAYSLRLLRKDYSGGLVRARAWDGSANQGEADVMAYRVSATEYVLDLNSTLENLDATAISRGLTTSDTLADLVSTGVNDYDGLTSAWYDQSLSNDATQSTAANQPKIVSGGSLVTENGKVAVDFEHSGTRTPLYLSNALSIGTNDFMIAAVVKNKTNQPNNYIDSSTNGIDALYIGNNPTLSQSGVGTVLQQTATVNNIDTFLINFIRHGGSIYSYLNGGSEVSATDSTDFSTPIDFIGDDEVIIQEIIIYNSDQSTNRTAIETNINNFYSIYP